MVSAGLGVTIVDPFAAQDATAFGVVVKPFRPVVEFEFAYILPAKKEPFAHVKRTIDLLRHDIATIKASLEASS